MNTPQWYIAEEIAGEGIWIECPNEGEADEICHVVESSFSREEAMKHAKLIAAAPAMRDACLRLLADWEAGKNLSEAAQEIQAVLP